MSEKRRILVIDDDDGIREVLDLTLTAEGYDVETAESGAVGLASLARRRADLVIADLKMPDIDGIQFCRAYAKFGDSARPVILMSAMPAHALAQDLPGVVEVITKPFDIEPFLELVAGAVAVADRVPLGFADLRVDVPSHVCLFYSNDDELRERLGFLAHTLDDPTQVAVLFGKQERLEEVLGYIGTDFSRDVAADRKAGRIVLVNGTRDPDALLGGIATALDAIVARGASLIRFLGFIGWGDMDWPPTEDLMTFEAKVTEAVKSYPAVVVCTYNTEKLPGPILIFAGIETHPITIVGTTLCENPHYVPFADYIARRERPTAAEREKNLRGVKVGPLRL